MRVLWTLAKVVIGLAIAIPLGIIALGILGSMLGLAVAAFRLACVAFVGYGLFRVARYVLAPSRKPKRQPVGELPTPDPYYDAAMRELDAEMGRR